MNFDFNTALPQERYKPPVVLSDPIEAFQAELLKYGLAPESIVADGTLQRFDVDKRNDKAGWYVLHSGQFFGGMFGNWITGDQVKWCSVSTIEMNDHDATEYQRIITEASKQRKKEKERLQKQAQKTAYQKWEKATPAINHEYLQAKNVKSCGLKQYGNDIIVPGYDTDGTLWTLQRIKPNGKKKFLFGGKIQGCFFTIPGNGHLYICEGYATGASIHEATGGTVIVAFNAGNLKPVAKEIRKKTSKNITICADNDQWTPGNPGITKAESAAREVNADVIIPQFENTENKPTDFNDLANLSGLGAVKGQLVKPWEKQAFPPLLAQNTRVTGRLIVRPAPIEFIAKYDNQGLIPKGIVGVLTATGGTGKSFFLLQLAYALAGGYGLGPIRAVKSTSVLYVAGEDAQDEIDRRLWNVGNGKFPENLHACSVYGEVGPLMRLDGNTPTMADGFRWLEATIQNHPGLEVLILDPKSRFYGLDENNSDHATQWIQSLEFLSKKYELTLLFSHHTSKNDGAKISQNMSRGSSAIVDGCRWQAGLVRMDDITAGKLGIQHPRLYVEFNAPKSNYAPDIPSSVFFKRNEYGILEYINVKGEGLKAKALAFLEIYKNSDIEYSKRELGRDDYCKDIRDDLKKQFSHFKKSEMPQLIEWLINKNMVEEVGINKFGRPKTVIKIIENVPF